MWKIERIKVKFLINFEKKLTDVKINFFKKLNLPDEITYSLTKITMLENNEIYIEGKNKIVDYYSNYIKVQLDNLFILIMGKNLEIGDISDEDVLISGEISSIEYIKR